MAGLAFEQHIINHAVFVQIPFRVRFPRIAHQFALDFARFLRVRADKIGFIVGFQRRFAGVFVKENHGHIRRFGFADDGGRSGGVNQVNRQHFHAFGQQHVHLVVLRRLAVLRIVKQQFGGFLRCRFRFQSLAHQRHKVIVIFINGNANFCAFAHRSRAAGLGCLRARSIARRRAVIARIAARCQAQSGAQNRSQKCWFKLHDYISKSGFTSFSGCLLPGKGSLKTFD